MGRNLTTNPVIFQNRPRNGKKVFARILRDDFRLTKGDTFEETFLLFHVQIFKNFLFRKYENNDCFFDFQFLK